MNSTHPLQDSSSYSRLSSDSDLKRLFASTFQLLEQPPPPTLREILAAYRTKGDGDRDMLIAMLNTKAAEDQRIAAMANLQRSLLDAYQTSSDTMPLPRNGTYHYPTPSFTQSPPLCEQRSSRRNQYPRNTSRSRSPPPRVHQHVLPPREPAMYHSEPPRKRHRGSHSPPSTHAGAYESHSGSQHEQFPPSPYSSSDRSNSAEYSPRSRQSMAIGSLLSAGPSKEINGDIQNQ